MMYLFNAILYIEITIIIQEREHVTMFLIFDAFPTCFGSYKPSSGKPFRNTYIYNNVAKNLHFAHV